MGYPVAVTDRSRTKMCVCCVFVPSIFGGSSSVQGETCATLCSVSRGLHLFSVLFCPTTRTNRGHRTGLFSSFYVSFLPHGPPAVLASIFIARRVRPSLSLVNTKVEFCLLTKLFSYTSLSTTRHECEKKLSPRLEPVTWLPEGYGDTN